MNSGDGDYVWHFKLSGGQKADPTPDALTEMIRQQLRAILGCVILTRNGTDLRVTGFRLLGEPATEHALYPEGSLFPSAPVEGDPGPG